MGRDVISGQGRDIWVTLSGNNPIIDLRDVPRTVRSGDFEWGDEHQIKKNRMDGHQFDHQMMTINLTITPLQIRIKRMWNEQLLWEPGLILNP